jgi:hypothetical protein
MSLWSPGTLFDRKSTSLCLSSHQVKSALGFFLETKLWQTYFVTPWGRDTTWEPFIIVAFHSALSNLRSQQDVVKWPNISLLVESDATQFCYQHWGGGSLLQLYESVCYFLLTQLPPEAPSRRAVVYLHPDLPHVKLLWAISHKQACIYGFVVRNCRITGTNPPQMSRCH